MNLPLNAWILVFLQAGSSRVPLSFFVRIAVLLWRRTVSYRSSTVQYRSRKRTKAHCLWMMDWGSVFVVVSTRMMEHVRNGSRVHTSSSSSSASHVHFFLCWMMLIVDVDCWYWCVYGTLLLLLLVLVVHTTVLLDIAHFNCHRKFRIGCTVPLPNAGGRCSVLVLLLLILLLLAFHDYCCSCNSFSTTCYYFVINVAVDVWCCCFCYFVCQYRCCTSSLVLVVDCRRRFWLKLINIFSFSARVGKS